MNHPTKVQGLEIRAVGDEVLVHDEPRGKVHVLNATAGAILEWCDGTRSTSDIAAGMAERYDIDAARAAHDAELILAEFRRLELLAA
ncbi:MAG: HPr-rel-A system PqqD family peptide chaperone [Candidatus Eremiobacteraeota bacterium]|nr:HPr-rel-A system PqqD family peptide chaperone [Candidatus Eremiobacteraeota bacterium]